MELLDNHLIQGNLDQVLIKNISFQKRINIFSICNLFLSISCFLMGITNLILFKIYLPHLDAYAYLIFTLCFLTLSYFTFKSFWSINIFRKNKNNIIALKKGLNHFNNFIKSIMTMIILAVFGTPILYGLIDYFS